MNRILCALKWKKAGLILGGSSLLLCLNAAASLAQTSTPRSYVYVESNIGVPGGNSVLGFLRDNQGSLTPLKGSPYLTGGTGVFDLSLALGPFDSDQSVVTDMAGKRLFAVNSGSNSIAEYNIQADGSLLPVQGSPFDSGGIEPVSIGLAGKNVLVVNKDMDPAQNSMQSLPNYTAFHLLPDGTLWPAIGGSAPVALGSSPSQALVSPDNRFLFGADFMGGLLQSFRINNGRLSMNIPTALPESQFIGSGAPHWPLGLAVNPQNPALYVGFVTINRIGVYWYDQTGKLSFANSVPDSGVAVCWLLCNSAGTRLYAVNTGDNSLSVFDISDPLFPNEIQKLTLKGNGSPFQESLDPDGGFLYVVSQRAGSSTPLGEGSSIHVLRIGKNGKLHEVNSSPTMLLLPSGTRPQGIASAAAGN